MNKSENNLKQLLDRVTTETFQKNPSLQERRNRLEVLEDFIFQELNNNPTLKEKFEEYTIEKEGLMLLLGDNMFLEGFSYAMGTEMYRNAKNFFLKASGNENF